MFKLLLFLACVAFSSQAETGPATTLNRASLSPSIAEQQQLPPSPYTFAYNTADDSGNQLTRQESGDETGAVRGSYSYRDADGLFRTVEYIADAQGFRANIKTNEPGLNNAHENAVLPANIQLQTESTPTAVINRLATAAAARANKQQTSSQGLRTSSAPAQVSPLRLATPQQPVIRPLVRTVAQPIAQPIAQPVVRQFVQPAAPVQPAQQPLIVRFIDTQPQFQQFGFQQAQPQFQTIALQTADSPMMRLFRIIPVSSEEGLRLRQAGANVVYLASAGQ